jgi:hypothetical protein
MLCRSVEIGLEVRLQLTWQRRGGVGPGQDQIDLARHLIVPLGTQTSPPGRSRSKAPFAATKPPDSVPNRQ